MEISNQDMENNGNSILNNENIENNSESNQLESKFDSNSLSVVINDNSNGKESENEPFSDINITEEKFLNVDNLSESIIEHESSDVKNICANLASMGENLQSNLNNIKVDITKEDNIVVNVEKSSISNPQKNNANQSLDDTAENFFEGLDEDTFIANLQVVSTWNDDSSHCEKLTSLNSGDKKKLNNNKTNSGNNIIKDIGRHKKVLPHESALSKFESYLQCDDETDNKLKNLQNKKKNKNKKINTSKDYKHEKEFEAFKSNFGSRRDPNKTKRDIEKDKANKTKDTLIKKMETGLIPPGLEMESISLSHDKSESDKNKSPCRVNSPVKKLYSSGSPERKLFISRSPDRKLYISPDRKLYISRNRKSNSREGRYYSRYREYNSSLRRSLSNISKENRRSYYSPPRFNTRHNTSRYDERERYESRYSKYDKYRDSEERHRKRYRSHSSRDDSPKSKSSKKEDFLSYLSKNNLVPETITENFQINPPQYINSNYVQPPIYSDVPPIESTPMNMPMQVIPSNEVSYLNVPNQPYSVIQGEIVQPVFNYSNEQIPYYDQTSMVLNPLPMSINQITEYGNEYSMSADINRSLLPENRYIPIYSDQEEKNKIINVCENVVKNLNNIQVPTNVIISTKEDLQQRDCSYSGRINNIDYCSPLNRDHNIQYNITTTGDKNKMIVPTVISSLNNNSLNISIPINDVKKDASTQTSNSFCDKCHLNKFYKKKHKYVSTFEFIKYKSEYSQVQEEDLINSKKIFTPNKGGTSESQKSISLTHMTPAQILVAELTAKAKSMQRTAVDTFRQAGGKLDHGNYYK